MPELSGRTVMITGASRGLGYALALAFAREGAQVSACARSADGLSALTRELQRIGARSLVEAVDVADEVEVGGWVERTRSLLGTPDVLINNASVLGPRAPLLSIAPQEWRAVLAANINGTFIVTRLVAPLMVAEGTGSIVNVSSGASLPPRINWGAYAVSKAAVDAFSYNLAAELSATGVRVNVVDPGAMRTSMRADAYPAEDPQTLKAADAIVPLFLWLAADASRAVTGQRFQADEWLRKRSAEADRGRA